MEICLGNILNSICLILSVLLIVFNMRVLKISANLQKVPLWVIPSIITAFLFMPLILFMLCVFAIFKQFINIILKIKHGSKFNGLLSGMDSLHMISRRPRHLVNDLLMFRCTKRMSPQVFYNNIKEVVRNMQQYEKFNSRFFTFCGYSYMLKEEFNADDCIREMNALNDPKCKLSKSKFLLLMNECCNMDLPKRNTVPWEMMVGKQSVDWMGDGHDYYPVLLRFEHVIMDGLTTMGIILKMFSDKTDSKIKYPFKEKKDPVRLKTYVDTIFKGVYMFILCPAFFISHFVIKTEKKHILSCSKLSEKNFFSVNFEDSPGYVQKIKKIKNTIPGAVFPDVVLVAFSASLNDYFIKKSVKVKYLRTAIPVSSKLQNIITPDQVCISDKNICNKVNGFISNVPIFVGSERDGIQDILKKLDIIKEEKVTLRNSLDIQMTALATNIISTYLPLKVYEWIIRQTKCTAIFSIFPGPSRIHCWQDSAVLTDILCFVSNAYSIGTAVVINTFDERLHIGITIDKSLSLSEKDVQEIASNIWKHIDELYSYVDSNSSVMPL